MGSLYQYLVRPLLFGLPPETAHELTGAVARLGARFPGGPALLRAIYQRQTPELRVQVGGVAFPSPIGLAAGFDKDGTLYPFVACLGFGFIESGTFTALGQPGNPKPRVFRYPQYRALVNRMGFNNPGAEISAKVLAKQLRSVPRGINLGKSKLTPVDQAAADYLRSLRLLAPYGDYVAVNVSSPNTPGLRSLQAADTLLPLLEPLLEELAGSKPLFVKLAPDLSAEEFEQIVGTLTTLPIAGLILTNTTLERDLAPDARAQAGGLSGAPLENRSTAMIALAYRLTAGKLPIIGVGGIFGPQDALRKIKAGASLIQIYTGFVYEGPGLPQRLAAGIAAELQRLNISYQELIGMDHKKQAGREQIH